jgi:hypothetical protein
MRDDRRVRQFLAACFALALGLGYIAAVVNLYFAHHMADGLPGLSYDDIVATYHGYGGQTLLGTMVQGEMRPHLASDEQLRTILDWLKGGAPQDAFAPVKAILDEQCIGCHNAAGQASFRPLTTFAEVSTATKPSNGVSWARLALLSHQHFFGIGLLCLAVGFLLLQTPLSRKWVALAIGVGFGGEIMDLGGMWLTKLSEYFAALIVAGGALSGVYFGFGIFVLWWDFFFNRKAAGQ